MTKFSHSAAIAHLRNADPRLVPLIEKVGPFALKLHDTTPFESLASAIVYQQLSGKAAATIYGRVVAACGGRVTPQTVLACADSDLRGAGLSFQKIRYIRDLATRADDGSLPLDSLARLPDDEVIEVLTVVKGIGVWTAQMYLMFGLGRPDVLPVADLGIQKGMQQLYRMRAMPDAARMIKVANPWRPFRTAACWYLWRSLELGEPVAKPRKEQLRSK